MSTSRLWLAGILMFTIACGLSPRLFGQGIMLPANGAVNRGMSGATTGAAMESIGSLYWNPATISHLPGNEMAFGFEALYPNFRLESTFPNVGTGSTSAENGVAPIPTIAWVHHMDPCTTIGLGLFGAAGYSLNMPANPNNPITSPQFALGGVGVGRIKADAIFFQMVPALSIKLSDRLSVGGGPVINMGKIPINANFFAPPNADGLYPDGDGTRYHWGLGAQLGFHYIHDCCWQFGGNLKTPMWFEPLRYFSQDAAGLPRVDEVDVTLPMILTTGLAYTGFQNALFTMDLRYFNYSDTEGLGDPAVYEADGRVLGLGWDDVFSVHFGSQFQLTERLVARMGYTHATELFDEADTFFNLGSDLSYRDVISMGFSFDLTQNAIVSMAYNYLPQWESTGPYVLPGIGAVAGSSITNRLDTHALTLGVNVAY